MLYAIAVVVSFHVALWAVILVLAKLEPPHPAPSRRLTLAADRPPGPSARYTGHSEPPGGRNQADHLPHAA